MGFAPPPRDGFALLASAHTDAFARCPAPSRGLSCHVTTAAYSCVRGVYVRYDTKHDRMPRNTKKRRGFRDYLPFRTSSGYPAPYSDPSHRRSNRGEHAPPICTGVGVKWDIATVNFRELR